MSMNRGRSLLKPMLLSIAAFLVLCSSPLQAQNNQCDQPGEEPDVIVGDLHELQRYGTVGDITAYSVGTVSCNVGTCWLNWFDNINQHPVIGQNMYRLKDGRFEQIGMSWLKHGFFALSGELCESGCIGTNGDHLGVNCSDPYSAGLNGSQSGLGPRSEVNAFTGDYAYPFTSQGQTGDAIYKRLQVHNDDLDPALNPGAVYLVEGQYVTPDDAAAGQGFNNASWRQVTIDDSSGNYELEFAGSTARYQPAVVGWTDFQGGVKISTARFPGEGLLITGFKSTSLGGGVWHYEYAMHNMDSHLSVGSFSVPVPEGATITNIGFHDVDYHSGEPYDGTDWPGVHDTALNLVTWSTEPYAVNPNANALRWGTMYSFRFDADVSPVNERAIIRAFRPGATGDATPLLDLPNPCNNDGVCDPSETCSNCAADCEDAGQGSCCGDDVCDGSESACDCARDCGPPPAKETVCTGGSDDDCDGQADCADLDCCADGACQDGIDGDSDGVAECDCDDGNNMIWSTPGETDELTLDAVAGSDTDLLWAPPLDGGALSVAYELLRSANPGDFGSAAVCLLGGNYTSTSAQDTDLPAPGILFSYLVRATNDCPAELGQGTLGYATGPVERIAAGCP